MEYAQQRSAAQLRDRDLEVEGDEGEVPTEAARRRRPPVGGRRLPPDPGGGGCGCEHRCGGKRRRGGGSRRRRRSRWSDRGWRPCARSPPAAWRRPFRRLSTYFLTASPCVSFPLIFYCFSILLYTILLYTYNVGSTE